MREPYRIMYKGELLTLNQLAKVTGIWHTMLSHRLRKMRKHGMTLSMSIR